MCSSKTRESLLTAACHINNIEARAPITYIASSVFVVSKNTPCRAPTGLGL